jgi:hypothetical protein
MQHNRWFSSILTTVCFTGLCALSACSGADENAVGTNGALSVEPLPHLKVQKGSGSTTALPPETPPACDQDGPITITGQGSKLWPPNHKFHEIAAPDCVGATDACGNALLGDFVWASSDEPIDDLGDGHFGPDIGLGVDVHHACVRSERQGPQDGRVYKLGVTFTDANGNVADGSCTIIVDHDQRGVTGADSGDAYKLTFDASQAGLNCDGTPPADMPDAGDGSGGGGGEGGNGGNGGNGGAGGEFCAPDDCLTGGGGEGGDGSGGGSAGEGGGGSGGGSAGEGGGGSGGDDGAGGDGSGGDGAGGGGAGQGGGGSGGDGSDGNGGAGGSGGNGGTPLPGSAGGPD